MKCIRATEDPITLLTMPGGFKFDLQAADPTVLSLPNGTKLSTDSRNLRSSVAVHGLTQLIEAHQRIPLPAADGIVENGQLVPNRTTAANIRTAYINQGVQEQKNLIADLGSR